MSFNEIRRLLSPLGAGGRGILCGMLIALGTPLAISAVEVTNGDFSSGLSGWQTEGPVFDSSGIAVLSDGGATRSLLYQPIGAASAAFTLSFDFRNALSTTVPNGALADTLFASIYFADSLGALDVPGSVFADSISLFDLDSTGAFNVNGILGASSKGADWVKFTLTFNSAHGFLVPVFDLRELNTVDNDSAVAIDNVILRTAPTVTSAPQSQGVPEGAEVTFGVVVSIERPVTFQWRFNDTVLSGATGDTISLSDVRLADAGRYTVAISDEFGTTLSPPAILAVLRIAGVEKNATGATVTFPTEVGANYTLEANGALGPTGWSSVGAGLLGDGATASIDDPGATAGQRFYRLRAFGGAGTPSGYLQITIPRKKTWPAANPFEPLAEDAGSVTARGIGTLEDAAAVWTPNQWTASPHLLRLTTGRSAGRIFAITGNTATQLTLDVPLEDLTVIVANGDRYEIAPLATIGSTFGIGSTALQTDESPSKADIVGVWNGKKFETFFNDGTGWKSTKKPPRGQPRADGNATLLYPDEGFTIKRTADRGTQPLTFTFTGQVPIGVQRTLLPAKGTSFVAQRFPAALPLGASHFETLPGWSKRDVVKIFDTSKLRFLNYTLKGDEWRIGRKNADAVPILPGTACFVVRRTKSGAAGVVAQDPPFTLSP